MNGCRGEKQYSSRHRLISRFRGDFSSRSLGDFDVANTWHLPPVAGLLCGLAAAPLFPLATVGALCLERCTAASVEVKHDLPAARLAG